MTTKKNQKSAKGNCSTTTDQSVSADAATGAPSVKVTWATDHHAKCGRKCQKTCQKKNELPNVTNGGTVTKDNCYYTDSNGGYHVLKKDAEVFKDAYEEGFRHGFKLALEEASAGLRQGAALYRKSYEAPEIIRKDFNSTAHDILIVAALKVESMKETLAGRTILT